MYLDIGLIALASPIVGIIGIFIGIITNFIWPKDNYKNIKAKKIMGILCMFSGATSFLISLSIPSVFVMCFFSIHAILIFLFGYSIKLDSKLPPTKSRWIRAFGAVNQINNNN